MTDVSQRRSPSRSETTKASEKTVIQTTAIEHAIVRVRGQNVMLDFDLAALYQVEVKALNQAVTRNAAAESKALRSQIVT